MAGGMQLRAETRVERGSAPGRLATAVSGRSLGGWLPAAAAAVLVLLAIDVVRQLQLDTADTGFAFFVLASGVAFAAALAVGRWPERRRMGLLILAWLLAEMAVDFAVDWPTSRLAVTLSALAIGLVPATYMLMVFSYPSGRVRDRLERLLVSGCFLLGLAWMTPPLLFADPRGCSSCAPRVPSLLYTGTTFDLTPAGRVFWSIFIVGGAAFVALLLRRLRQAPPGARVTLLPLGFAVVFAVSEFIAQRIVWLGGWQSPLGALDRVDQANTLVLPVAIFLGIAMVRRRRGPLGDLVVELGSARPGQVRAALARALGDPTLELGLWLPDRREFVDEQGEPLEVNTSTPGRAVTLIGPEREPLAALVHDERLLGQGPLLEAAGSAARLALENTRLQVQLRAQLAELRASRLRIVSAGDTERRRLERDLHDGAQQRLLALGLALQLLRDHQGDPHLLEQAEDELQTALHELRDLARGIHPSILSEQGLAPAVRSLTARAPLPVSTRIGDDRYPQAIESAAYFVIAEALTNIAKHAQAHSAQVSIAREDGLIVVEVSDDGRGGADSHTGGGLQGLADRIGALDGQLTIASDAGTGTTIRAEMPCASS
jgi:signal transduction histidine kinase